MLHSTVPGWEKDLHIFKYSTVQYICFITYKMQLVTLIHETVQHQWDMVEQIPVPNSVAPSMRYLKVGFSKNVLG